MFLDESVAIFIDGRNGLCELFSQFPRLYILTTRYALPPQRRLAGV